ncbi:unnamed protein product, partial [Phaeothamnion confervicola]
MEHPNQDNKRFLPLPPSLVDLSAACSCLSLVFGHLVHFVNPFRLVGVGLSVWTVAVLLSGLAYHLPQTPGAYAFLLLARMLSGAGEASFLCIVPPFISDTAAPRQRGLHVALFYAAIPVGTASGYAYGAVVANSRLGWGWAFAFEFGGKSVGVQRTRGGSYPVCDSSARAAFQAFIMAPLAAICFLIPASRFKPAPPASLPPASTEPLLASSRRESLSAAAAAASPESPPLLGALHGNPVKAVGGVATAWRGVATEQKGSPLRRISSNERSAAADADCEASSGLLELDAYEDAGGGSNGNGGGNGNSNGRRVRRYRNRSRSNSNGNGGYGGSNGGGEYGGSCGGGDNGNGGLGPAASACDGVRQSWLAEAQAVLSSRVFVCILLGYASYTAVTVGLSTFGSSFLVGLGLFSSEQRASVVFGVLVSLAGAIGTPLGGRIMDRCDPDGRLADEEKLQMALGQALIMVTLAACFVLLAAATATALVPFLAALLCGCFFLFGSTAAINTGIMLSVPTANRSLALAVNTLGIHALGDVPSPIIIGALKDWLAPHCAPCTRGGAFGVLFGGGGGFDGGSNGSGGDGGGRSGRAADGSFGGGGGSGDGWSGGGEAWQDDLGCGPGSDACSAERGGLQATLLLTSSWLLWAVAFLTLAFEVQRKALRKPAAPRLAWNECLRFGGLPAPATGMAPAPPTPAPVSAAALPASGASAAATGVGRGAGTAPGSTEATPVPLGAEVG